MTLQERVAGCAQEDSDRGDVTARLTPRPFKKQIPRGLKPARDDKKTETGGTTEVVPCYKAKLTEQDNAMG